MLLVLASASAVAVVLLATIWRQRQSERPALAPVPIARFEFSQTQFAGDVLDVAAEMHAVLDRLGPAAVRQRVRFDLATQPDVTVHADPAVCRQVLTDAVSSAIAHAPGGRVLLSAFRLGPLVQIAVSDDRAATNGARNELRPAAELAALQGGGLDLDIRPNEGTTIIIRLPAAVKTAAAPAIPVPLRARRPAEPRSSAVAPRRKGDPVRLG